MKSWAVVLKAVGETPLMALERFRARHAELSNTPLSYAGRLDPMASGKLLLLIGDECRKQGRYTSLDKEYDIEILLGVRSDTGDALGIVESTHSRKPFSRADMMEILRREVGTFNRPYPRYSSKTVNGVPLFLHALRGTIDSITIPTHREVVHSITLLNIETVSDIELTARVESYLSRVPRSTDPRKEAGQDFRIDAVAASWKEELGYDHTYTVLKVRVVCGSGTYMRTLAERVGTALGAGGLALSIHRSRIGRYWHGLWIRNYS